MLGAITFGKFYRRHLRLCMLLLRSGFLKTRLIIYDIEDAISLQLT